MNKRFHLLLQCANINAQAISGLFGWIGGSNELSVLPNYGTINLPDPNNHPGSRQYHDGDYANSTNSFYIFGGQDSGGDSFNDLWKYDLTNGIWTWISGSNVMDTPNFGTLNVANSLNMPGARNAHSVTFASSTNSLYVFAGDGYTINATSGNSYSKLLNDLWCYNLKTKSWMLISGSMLPRAYSVYGPIGVPSTSNVVGARNAHAMVYVSSQNSLYLFGGLGFATTGDYDFLNDMWRFNLTSAIWTFLGGNTDSTFDASYGILNVENPTNIPGGRWSHSMVYVESKNALYLFGGFGYDSAYNQGSLNDLWKYSLRTSKWTWISGGNLVNQAANFGQQYVENIANVPGARDTQNMVFISSISSLIVFGGQNSDSIGSLFNDVWRFSLSSNLWTWIGGTTEQQSAFGRGNFNNLSTTNYPGSRQGCVMKAVNSLDEVLIHGGYGASFSDVGEIGTLGDLWVLRFNTLGASSNSGVNQTTQGGTPSSSLLSSNSVSNSTTIIVVPIVLLLFCGISLFFGYQRRVKQKKIAKESFMKMLPAGAVSSTIQSSSIIVNGFKPDQPSNPRNAWATPEVTSSFPNSDTQMSKGTMPIEHNANMFSETLMSQQLAHAKNNRNHPLFSETQMSQQSAMQPSRTGDSQYTDHSNVNDMTNVSQTQEMNNQLNSKVYPEQQGFTTSSVPGKDTITNTSEKDDKLVPHLDVLTVQSGMTYLTSTFAETDTSILSVPGFLKINDSGAYRLEKKMGKGGGGDVFFAEVFDEGICNRMPGRKFVAKVMASGGKEAFTQEIAIMSLFLRHPNFASIVGFDEEKLTLLMVLYPLGSLDSWIANTPVKKMFSVVHILTGMTDAIFSLQEYGIVHNDIKPPNVLVDIDTDGEPISKLTDFGICNIVDSTSIKVNAFKVHNRRGFSIRYAAPERISKVLPIRRVAESFKRADVYSTAIVIFEIVTSVQAWNMTELDVRTGAMTGKTDQLDTSDENKNSSMVISPRDLNGDSKMA